MSSWETPAEDSWNATEAQPELSAADDKVAPANTAGVVAPDEPTGEVTGETTAGATSPTAASPTASEVRKSSLADLTNGDREAITAHLAQGLGPHKLLSRFTNQKPDAEPTITNGHAAHTEMSEPDGAASVVDDSTSNVSISAGVTKDERSQTAPDLDNLNLLTGFTPSGSVIESAAQSPNLSPRSVRKPGPHHRLKALALAQDIPLPQSPAPIAKSSTSDEGPATPVASAIDLEPAVIQDSPSAPPNTVEDGNDSDVSSLAYEAFKTEFPNSLSVDAKVQNLALNPKASDYLPPSRSTSPFALAKRVEAESINNCCPVPSDWSVPHHIGNFADGVLFGGPTIGDIHKTALRHYSQYFATAFAVSSDVVKEELDLVVKDPSFTVFRVWLYGRKLYITSADGVISRDMNIDLKILVQLWRFAARIQAPLFANVVADAIIAKTITASQVSAAADEIDTVLKVVAVNNPIRLLLSHAVILSGIQIDQDQGETWPQSLLWSILNCLKMGRSTYAAVQMHSKTNPCMYHLHPLGKNCSSV
jgi:hypothetical protein